MLVPIISAIIIAVLLVIYILTKNSAKNENKCMVYIEGMMCGHCKAHVEKAFSEAGFSVKVDLENKCAEIASKKEFSEEQIKAIVEKAGYTFVKCE